MTQPDSDRVRLPRRGPGTKTVRLVFLATLTTALLMGAMLIHLSYEQARRRIHQTHPAVLQWSAEALRNRLEQGRAEVARTARTTTESLSRGTSGAALERLLSRALESSRTFSGLLLLDPSGQIRAEVGSGPELAALIDAVGVKDAVRSELLDVMHSVQLRRELTAVEAASVRAFHSEDVSPSALASAPLRDARGQSLGSLHGVLRREELSAQLRGDLLGGGDVYLSDAEGRVIAAVGGGGTSPEPLPPESLHGGNALQVRVPWSGDETWVVKSALPLGVLGWTLVVQQNVLQAFQGVWIALPQIGLLAVAALALFTFAASRVAGGTSRLVQELFDGVRRVAKGDLGVELPDANVRGQFEVVFRTFNAMTRRLRQVRDETDVSLRAFQEQNLAFQNQHEVLSRLSVTDGLTELHNHRYFQEQLKLEIKRLSRTNKGLAILMIDIDDFKQINDRFGHAAGDGFLKQLACVLKESVRETDMLARYGGEEFVVVTTGTDLAGAVVLAEKLRIRISETSFIVDDSMRPRKVTVSIGVAEYRHSQSELFTTADAALYRAKASGKNCVVAADPPEGEA